MKLCVFPYGCDWFYMKPDTALAKPTDDFYVPDGCSQLWYTPFFALKINRLGRHIEPRFAPRYYDEINVGICLYGGTEEAPSSDSNVRLVANTNTGATPWANGLWLPGTVMDYSVSMPRTFIPKEEAARVGAAHGLETLMQLETLAPQRIAFASQFVYLKMGDLILLEAQSPAPLPVHSRVQLSTFVDFVVR